MKPEDALLLRFNSGKDKDVYIYREGEDILMRFHSKQAMAVLESFPELMKRVTKQFDYYWMPIDPNSVNKQIIWIMSHGLTFETDVPFIIKK